MPRDSAATRARILDAATVEFSAHGLAGARVDRIAERAGANKQLIYAYFQSKESLFDSVLQVNIERLLDAVPFDARDLPAYSVRLLHFHATHPELGRLALWHSLERPGVLPRLPQAAESAERKRAAIAQGQAEGTIDATLDAGRLLALVLGVVHAAALDDLSGLHDGGGDLDARREAVALAVRRLVTPMPAAASHTVPLSSATGAGLSLP